MMQLFGMSYNKAYLKLVSTESGGRIRDFDNQKVHILTNPRGGWRVYSKEDRTEVLRGDPGHTPSPKEYDSKKGG